MCNVRPLAAEKEKMVKVDVQKLQETLDGSNSPSYVKQPSEFAVGQGCSGE